VVSDPFESAKFSIKLASRHAGNFNLLAKEFIESEPYTSRSVFNAPAGVHELKVKIVRDFPEDLRGYASDAIKNIRDALDQAMYAATLVVTGKKARHAHFPFGESEADLEKSLWTDADRSSGERVRKTRNTKDIPESLFPAIRAIKPYPHDGDQWALKTLQKISGPHKHGVALTLGSAPAFSFETMEMRGTNQDGTPASVVTQFQQWDATEKEFVVAVTTGLPPDGSFITNVPFHIAFDHPELKFVPAGALIDRWGKRTDAIITGLETVAARIVAERGA
jgi:hypothetical protein